MLLLVCANEIIIITCVRTFWVRLQHDRSHIFVNILLIKNKLVILLYAVRSGDDDAFNYVS